MKRSIHNTSLLGGGRLFAYLASMFAVGSMFGMNHARANGPEGGQAPRYGTVTLKAGFTPDPFTKTLTAGGAIKTKLGGVSSHVSRAPDFKLYYTAGALPLRIYVESAGDTTLLVNLPDGSWIANDDGGVGNDPQLTFAKPPSGRYDIWVGTFGAKTAAATLRISERTKTAVVSAYGPLPIRVDLRPEFERLGLVAREQGFRDVCTSFAITALADFELARKDPTSPRLSEEFLIWAANAATGREGDQAMFYEAVHGLNAFGICSQSMLPYRNTGNPKQVVLLSPSAQQKADAKQRSRRWKVEWIKRVGDIEKQLLTDREFEAIRRALAIGHPVAVGMRWPSKPGSDLLDPKRDVASGGHVVALVGYEQDAKKPGGGVFFLRNSFGPRWGSDGYGTVSFAYARAHFNDALWLQCGAVHSETPRERFEAEQMTVLSASKCRTNGQKMDTFGAKMWSRGEQLLCGAERGGHVELGFTVSKAGAIACRLLGTAGPDFGTIRVMLDGKSVGSEFDLYSVRVSPSGSLELGALNLAAGTHRIRIAAANKSPASTNYFFGIDALDLLAAD